MRFVRGTRWLPFAFALAVVLVLLALAFLLANLLVKGDQAGILVTLATTLLSDALLVLVIAHGTTGWRVVAVFVMALSALVLAELVRVASYVFDSAGWFLGGALTGLMLSASVMVIIRRRRARLSSKRQAAGLCGRCGYCLTGNMSGVCPECGSAVLVMGTGNGQEAG